MTLDDRPWRRAVTTFDLEPIKERLAAATSGPWRVWRDPDPTKVRATAVETAWCHGDIEGDTELITDYLPTDADATFIANAPEDIAALVAEVERLRGQVEAVKALHVPVDRILFAQTVKVCTLCPGLWPCPTIRALEAA